MGIAGPVWALLDLCGHGTGLREQGERKEDRRKEKHVHQFLCDNDDRVTETTLFGRTNAG